MNCRRRCDPPPHVVFNGQPQPPLVDRGYNAPPAPRPGWLVWMFAGLTIACGGAALLMWMLEL